MTALVMAVRPKIMQGSCRVVLHRVTRAASSPSIRGRSAKPSDRETKVMTMPKTVSVVSNAEGGGGRLSNQESTIELSVTSVYCPRTLSTTNCAQ
jgi:hypothetical protein